MKNFISKYKFDFIWLFTTAFIIISINISYMYSRDKTLNTVEKNQFKLFINLMHTTSLNSKKFSNITNALTIVPRSSQEKTRQALFHIALITSKTCTENGKHSRNKPLLCTQFPNAKILKGFLTKEKRTYSFNGHDRDIIEYSTKKLGINDKRYNAYLIKKRNNTNKWIVAKKRYFYKDSSFENFYFFITKRYLQTTSLYGKYKTTKAAGFIILSISFLLWLLLKSRERKNLHQYSKLIKSRQDINSKILILDTEYNKTKSNIFTIEEQIKKQEILLTSDNHNEAINKKEIIESIRTKTIQQTQLNNDLIQFKNKIMQLEASFNAIEELLNDKRIKLNSFKRNTEYTKISQDTMTVRQLWRHEPTWEKRQEIESTVSLTPNNLPFTITQAFISFESHIDNEIEKYFNGTDKENALNKTLIKKIEIISKYTNMQEKTLTLYHNIRKARNKWVHGTIYPEKKLLENLLLLLEDTDTMPHL